MPPPLPTTIGRYDIISLLGRGGMGVLYKAKDPVLDRDVALKMMLVDFSFDGTARERFEREAKAVARLQHHNVVTIHELGQHEGAPYIVMELLSGEDLDAVLRRSEPLPMAAKLEIVAQLCEGLAYAHGQGIVHRDIKPANVRVLEDGTVKILDFGIAKFAQSSMTQSGSIMGTAHYMAPEQILGGPIDGRADLFSVGVLLQELLTGKKPFGGDSPTAVVYQIMHGEPPSLADAVPGLPDGLTDIVTRALKKNPDERYDSASDMASDLRLVKMLLDLPVTPSAPAAAVDTPMPTARLHATSVMRKPSVTGPVGAGTASGAGAAVDVAGATVPTPRRVSVATTAAAGAVLVLGAVAYFALRDATPVPQAITPSAQPPSAPAAPAPVAPTAAAPAATVPAAVTSPRVVVITSVPAGARILLNGADTGKTTPSTISPGGTVPSTVGLMLKGYQPLSASLVAADVERGNREFRLVREASAVLLTISGTFPFDVTRAGVVLSPMATHHEVTIPPDPAPVIARNAAYLLSETVPLDFQKSQAEWTIKAPGVLAVFASIETCSIVVDGRDVGFPPLPRYPIAAGPHTVVLKCPDGKEESRKMVVAPGERSPLTFGPPR